MTTRNDVPGDKFKKSNSWNDENIPPPGLKSFAMEEERHSTHSFEWCWSHKKIFTTITCDRSQTVEDCLTKSSQFRQVAEKQGDKELVVVRGGRAISSHFPCRLIKNERLNVKFVKAVDKPKKPSYSCTKVLSSELVIFHMLTRGGKNITKILKNPALRKDFQEITIYAYKGEKVKQALRRDGRILSTVLKKNWVLSHTSTDVNTEMTSLVNDLDGKTFKIKLLNKSSLPESQPGSLDPYTIQSESQMSYSGGNEDLSQQSTTADNNAPETKPDLCGNMVLGKKQELPFVEKMQGHLSSEFKDMVKRRKTKASGLCCNKNLVRLEFGSNPHVCRDVKTLKKLMDLSNSVCQVRINEMPRGSGFLWFGNFVLTNAHVINGFCNPGQPNERVTVTFSYESLEQNDNQIDVEEVVGSEYYPDVSGTDWALLRLSADKKLPDGLLTHFGFHSPSNKIYIIGHPEGGVKRMDPCLIVSSESRSQIVEKHQRENQWLVQYIDHTFFDNVQQSVQQRKTVLTYESCCYDGSSGSPVFSENGRVIAMHTGGYAYPDVRGQTQSVIEFGYPLLDINERIIVQMVEREKFDVLKEYLACSCTRKQDILIGVKKLVESRNLTTFKNVVNNSVTVDDKSLKAFFEFFFLKEEPVPMEIN